MSNASDNTTRDTWFRNSSDEILILINPLLEKVMRANGNVASKKNQYSEKLVQEAEYQRPS